MRLILIFALNVGLFLPLSVLAHEEQAQERTPAGDFIYAVLPLAILGLILWWFLRKSQRSPFMQRSIEYYERSEQHLQRMEQIGERIATALEKIEPPAGHQETRKPADEK